MPLVTPTPIPSFPPAPLVTDDRVTFSAKAFALASAYEPQRVSFNTAATETNTNAAYAHERANAAAGSATAAAGSATTAGNAVTAVNQTVADILAAKNAIQAGPVASVMGRTGVVTGLVETSVGAFKDKTALMADAPIGQPTIYSSGNGAGADWPTAAATCCWVVETIGAAARKVQIATQVLNVGGQQGWKFERYLHDTVWSVWTRVFTDRTVIDRVAVDANVTSGTYTADPAVAAMHYIYIGANTIINVPPPRAIGDQLTMRICQLNAYSYAFASNVKLPVGAALPALPAGQTLTAFLMQDNQVAGGWVLNIGSKH